MEEVKIDKNLEATLEKVASDLEHRNYSDIDRIFEKKVLQKQIS